MSVKKVACLMMEHSLNARRKRKYIRNTDSKHTFGVSENILNRDFDAESGVGLSGFKTLGICGQKTVGCI